MCALKRPHPQYQPRQCVCDSTNHRVANKRPSYLMGLGLRRFTPYENLRCASQPVPATQDDPVLVLS